MVFHGFSMILQIKKTSFFFRNFHEFPVVFHWFSHSKTSIDSSMRFFPTPQDGPLGWKPWSCRAFRPRRRPKIVNIRKKRVVNDGKLTFIFFQRGWNHQPVYHILYHIIYHVLYHVLSILRMMGKFYWAFYHSLYFFVVQHWIRKSVNDH